MANTKPKSSQVIYGKNSSPTVENALDALQPALAMAKTFTVVPTTFQSYVIFVTQPHFRTFVWDGTKYVRAPWHQPGTLRHAYRGIRPGELEVRADVVLQSADFPDLAEYLSVTGPTFVLDEARAEFIRNADSGRGKDAGRVIGSHQGDAGRNLTGNFYQQRTSTNTIAIGAVGLASGAFGKAGAGHLVWEPAGASSTTTNNTYMLTMDASRQWPVANEFRVTNRAYIFAVTF